MTTTDKEKAAWFILDKTIFTNMLNVAAVSLPRREDAVRIPRLNCKVLTAGLNSAEKRMNKIVRSYQNLL